MTQRVLGTLPTFLGIATLVFLAVRVLSGDPASVLAAQAGGSPALLNQLRAQYGLDKPLSTQYLTYLSEIARLDLGRSIFTGQSVAAMIAQQAPATLALAMAAIVLAVALGLVLGILAATHQGTWIDRACMGIAVLGVSVPIALSGLLLILVFSLSLRWLPATGQGTPLHLILPATAMGLASSGSIARVVRTQLLEVLDKDYIRVARAKGLSEIQVLVRHALRTTLPTLLNLVGLQFGFMLGGAVITESVFARQGLGRTLVEAILYYDYPVIQGTVLVSAAIYTGINLIVDLAHCYSDPTVCER
ncbi:MAG: ABC transporter permease [Anaerolineae bacterium]|jgi:ABC-type dipeptide/oligopeptide/nickel transport system permease component